jgi:tetratricopeptide (TPR) repeat protein
MANTAQARIESWNIGTNVGAATTYLNCATVYKAFGMAADALPLFEQARGIYENELNDSDPRLAGLYNNMALALVDLSRFREANELYDRAISIMERAENGSLEVAITYLNMASAAESEFGLLDADETICELLDKARELLENATERDGYYAFVCEKCASVFDYYGQFLYAKELEERARRIYEDNEGA